MKPVERGGQGAGATERGDARAALAVVLELAAEDIQFMESAGSDPPVMSQF